MKVAEVIIDNSNKNLDKEFDYNIPISLEDKLKVGYVVSVPFGKGNKLIEGYVVGIKDKSEFENLKDISEIVSKECMINEERVLLARWMCKEYFCNFSDCLRLMLPSKIVNLEQQGALYANLLIDKKILIELIDNKKLRGIKQIEVLNYLFLDKSNLVSDILRSCNTTIGTLRSLEKKKMIEIYEDVVDKDPLKDKVFNRTCEFVPNDYQRNVICMVNESIVKEEFSKFLIHGVTGSGKTEVYLQLIKKVLEQEKQAIVLVPEISLTPQMIERFVGRFGNKVAVLHSRLSDGQRKDQWYKIKNGEVSVVVGARSAIFAPFEKLGIVIIDEEHENTYKSEQTPKYNAIDVAMKRCEIESSVLVLGSATPTVVDYYNANCGKYNLLEIPIRANANSSMPKVELVDMKKELENGNKSCFSSCLHDEIEKNIISNEQTILFLNKRGYSSFVLCRNCGYVVRCKNCNVSLTYHSINDRLVCHYCGYNEPLVKVCPKCKSNYIRHFGIGTQKLEEMVKKEFPSASVLRMDMDTTSKKDSHEKILSKFKNENVNVLIGTQMIAKGHDFPNVTLVGVISADMMLNLDDFRATEKTFELLTQVEGRAGRADKPGRVIVQSYDVENFSILNAINQDYTEFYNNEIYLREKMLYPPFKDIVVINFSSLNYKTAKDVAVDVLAKIKKMYVNDESVFISEVMNSPLSKVNNRYRLRIIVKCDINDVVRNQLFDLIKEKKLIILDKCSITIDVNPMTMM